MRANECLVLLVLAALAHAAVVVKPRACLAGEACVAIKECPSLLELLKHNATQDEKSRLQSALCGYLQQEGDGRTPKSPMVCCGLLPTVAECGPVSGYTGPPKGNRTFLMEVPWVARLGYRGPSGATSYQCGGALISSRYVLTAARCIASPGPPVTVRLGEWDLSTDEDCEIVALDRECSPPVVDVAVEDVIAHPEYVDDGSDPHGYWNDIALLRLAQPVTYTDAVQPVCLPVLPDFDEQSVRRRYHVTGWGKIGKGGTEVLSDRLFKLTLNLMNHSDCAARLHGEFPHRIDDARQACGGRRDGRDACAGDTGGAVTKTAFLDARWVRSVLYGVVSFGPAVCAARGAPAVFTRVTHYMSWILSNLRP